MKLTEVTVTRTVPATAGEVFDVWIDAKSPGGPWFGSHRVILSAVTDGLFYLAVKHEDAYGRITGGLCGSIARGPSSTRGCLKRRRGWNRS
jgi:hypothetical protein